MNFLRCLSFKECSFFAYDKGFFFAGLLNGGSVINLEDSVGDPGQ